MFDLNEKKFGGTIIFNDGKGGLVKNVTISVEKAKLDEPETYPDYKLIVDDGKGGKINHGFYYPKSTNTKSIEDNEKAEVREVSRIVHLARAVMGSTYEFPKTLTAAQAFDTLFKLVADNCAGKKYNVFITYGTEGYPNEFMKLRYFDFIEDASVTTSRLRVKNGDLLERMVQDAPTVEFGPEKKTEESTDSWL